MTDQNDLRAQFAAAHRSMLHAYAAWQSAISIEQAAIARANQSALSEEQAIADVTTVRAEVDRLIIAWRDATTRRSNAYETWRRSLTPPG